MQVMHRPRLVAASALVLGILHEEEASRLIMEYMRQSQGFSEWASSMPVPRLQTDRFAHSK